MTRPKGEEKGEREKASYLIEAEQEAGRSPFSIIMAKRKRWAIFTPTSAALGSLPPSAAPPPPLPSEDLPAAPQQEVAPAAQEVRPSAPIVAHPPPPPGPPMWCVPTSEVPPQPKRQRWGFVHAQTTPVNNSVPPFAPPIDQNMTHTNNNLQNQSALQPNMNTAQHAASYMHGNAPPRSLYVANHSSPRNSVFRNAQGSPTSRRHDAPPLVIHVPAKAPSFESKDAALKALQRKKRLVAWREKMKQQEEKGGEEAQDEDATDERTAQTSVNDITRTQRSDVVDGISKQQSYDMDSNTSVAGGENMSLDSDAAQGSVDSDNAQKRPRESQQPSPSKSPWKMNDAQSQSSAAKLSDVKADWAKDDATSSRQQRLDLLEHSSKCDAQLGKCKVYEECTETKKLWKHMRTCRDAGCAVEHCSDSREILRAYFDSMPNASQETPGLRNNSSSQDPLNRPITEEYMYETMRANTQKKKRRLFKNRLSVPVHTAAAALLEDPSSATPSIVSQQVDDPSQSTTAAAKEPTRQRRPDASNKAKKKAASPPPMHINLWDYAFHPSDSSDNEDDFENVLQMDVDVVGDSESRILSKSLPGKSQIDNLSMRETSAVQSRVRDMENQIQRADEIIQSAAPSCLVYQSKGWTEVASSADPLSNSTDSVTQKLVAVPPSNKFHASSNSASKFLSLFKSIAMTSCNSHQLTNAYVMAFLSIIKESRNSQRQWSPFKLMKRVCKLIQHITMKLDDNEKEKSRRKLKKEFDVFLPQGYSMLSEHYMWSKGDKKRPEDGEFEESCARTYLAFDHCT